MEKSNKPKQSPQELKERRHLHYLKNKEVIKARVSAYQKLNKEKISLKNKAYRKRNKKKFKKRSREYYEANKEKLRQRSREYHRNNREALLPGMKARYRKNKKKNAKKRKAYYVANRERVLAKSKEWRLLNPERSKRRALEYRHKNIEKIRAHDRKRSRAGTLDPKCRERRRAYSQRNKEKTYAKTKGKVLEAKTLFGNKCAKCGYSKHVEILEFDHIVPIRSKTRSRHWLDRGPAVLKNPSRFQLLCPICHAIKTALEKMARGNPSSPWNKKRARARARLVEMFWAKCGKCGYKENHLAFRFDHIIPIINSNRTWSPFSEIRRNPERFQLLCANCHSLKTLSDMRAHRAKKASESGGAVSA